MEEKILDLLKKRGAMSIDQIYYELSDVSDVSERVIKETILKLRGLGKLRPNRQWKMEYVDTVVLQNIILRENFPENIQVDAAELIKLTYFPEYIKGTFANIDIPHCIFDAVDWKKVAAGLIHEYSEVSVFGQTYFYRIKK